MSVASDIKLRPLERGDLHFVHKINNNDVIMRYWFEEPYEAYDELVALYDRHLHDQNERRFIIEHDTGQPAGLVELVEIDYIHRRAEFQIIIAPSYQGRGYAKAEVDGVDGPLAASMCQSWVVKKHQRTGAIHERG